MVEFLSQLGAEISGLSFAEGLLLVLVFALLLGIGGGLLHSLWRSLRRTDE